MFLRTLALCFLIVAINSSEIKQHKSSKSESIEFSLSIEETVEPVVSTDDKPVIDLYYESLCPYCRDFDSNYLLPMLEKMQIYVDVTTYPFGNAKIIDNEDGSKTVICQHGRSECYGNRLHACAIKQLNNKTFAIQYNGCMMDDQFEHGSNDAAADECGKKMSIHPEQVDAIKECAKGDEGKDLLVMYGEISKKVGFKNVPYVLINKEEWRGENEGLFKAVCKAFKNPPEPCNKF